MTCTAPVPTWPASPDAADRRVVFSPGKSYQGARSKLLPCGQCLSCRLTKAQHWATRILHEAQMHDANCFVTLTYEDAQLPRFGQLVPLHAKQFMRRVVVALGKTRYFLVGELGDDNHRPHYHAILFGQDFGADRYFWRTSKDGHRCYRSPKLEQLWPYGLCEITDVTTGTAEYIGRYSVKKQNGDRAAAAADQEFFDPATGEVVAGSAFLPFARMSLRPGIGSSWFDRFARDVFPSDFLVIDGTKRAVPPFYTKRLADMAALKVRVKRIAAGRKHADNNTDRRLMTRHESRELKAAKLRRDAEMMTARDEGHSS